MCNISGFGRFVLLTLCVIGPLSAAELLPTNNDPSNQIRFDSPSEALARRQQLIDFIWSSGLPTLALPRAGLITDPAIYSGDLKGIISAYVSTITKLDVNVSNFDFFSTSYLLRPINRTNENRYVIVHQGHEYDPFAGGIGATVNSLLQQGFSVDVMQMPLYGWQQPVATATVPGQSVRTFSNWYHNPIIWNIGPRNGGMGYRLFLEPVIQNINYIEQQTPAPIDISMIGLSGGGWTTSMVAAIDPRIKLSIPVAGSAPLYIRNTHSQPGTYGDLEQHYAPLFAEDIDINGNGGGIATWTEIYVLGGYGAGRRQIMVTNQFDNCCFGGANFADPFKSIVADTVQQLGAGKWEYILDTVAPSHQLSTSTLVNVIEPALQDSDADGVPDARDNCILVSNPDQRDTDGDGFGNLCDGDFNNDGISNSEDLKILRRAYRSAFGNSGFNTTADFNSDGVINTLDLAIFKTLYRKVPGPSGLTSP